VKIVVHIDRLVLDGVGQHDLPRLQAALEQELTQALGAPAGSGPLAGAEFSPIDLARGPEAIGQAIARAAHARIAASPAGSPPAGSPPRAPSPPSTPMNAEAKA
jgi:hypothetical protein